MLLATASPRNLSVRHIPDESVTKRVLALAAGRRTIATENTPAIEFAKTGVDLATANRRNRRNSVGPEGSAYGSGSLNERLLLSREGVETCSDDALDGLGHR